MLGCSWPPSQDDPSDPESLEFKGQLTGNPYTSDGKNPWVFGVDVPFNQSSG